jgi:hypothetical protein
MSRALVALFASVVLCSSCKRGSGRSVNLLGSTSIQPFAEILAEHYEKKHPGQFVEVQGGGSTAGLQAAEHGLDRTAFFLLGELIEIGPTAQVFTRPTQKRTNDYLTGQFG